MGIVIARHMGSQLRLQKFQDNHLCGVAVAAALLHHIDDGLANRGRATIGLSGGRTPAHVLPYLFTANRDWRRVTITFSDDRWVSQDSIDSTEGMVRRLVEATPAAAASIVGLVTGHATPAEGIHAVARVIDDLSWPLDAIYLGMGTDGHIASLFPRVDWRPVSGRVLAVSPPEAGASDAGALHRITLNPEALLDCRQLLLMFSGTEKAAIYARALLPGSLQELPLRVILHQDKVPISVFQSP